MSNRELLIPSQKSQIDVARPDISSGGLACGQKLSKLRWVHDEKFDMKDLWRM